jgi:delta14-sterol reductase
VNVHGHIAGFFAPWLIYLLVLALHLLLPARLVEGYVGDPATGRPMQYRLNGLAVCLAAVVLWSVVCWLGWIDWDWLYRHRFSALTGACTLGLGYTLIVVFSAPPTGKPLLTDLFLGRAENPQYAGRVDAKMYLYMAGATLLALNVLSSVAHHRVTFGAAASPGVYLHGALFAFFLLDYLWFERVHLYTYDLFAERVGFKLGWGCLVFYPYFYPVGLWGTAHLATPWIITEYGAAWLVPCALIFLCGWILARGANMQKYVFKRFPERAFLKRLAPETLSGGNLRVLCNGFWGVARHINYLGEILMALGLALALGRFDSIWPWLYPLYYVALLVPRERDDDRRCAEKYGPLWDRYRARVPYRIIPGIY